jgi:D-xylose transport system substrate-binding protein
MTVFKDTRELAKSAIDAAIKLAKGEVVNTNTTVNNDKINVPVILVNPIAIDKNNINSVLIGSGYYKKEDIISLTSP